MRIAIVPVETDNYDINNTKLFGMTSISYLFSYLEKYFPDDEIFPAVDLRIILQTKPDIIGIYAPYSKYFNKVIEIAREIKEHLKVPLILGGPHITYLPKSLPPIIDVGVIGEGEETFRDLITIFKDDKYFNEKNLNTVPGVVFHYKGQKMMTDKRKAIQDLDSIPLTRKFFYQMPGNWVPSMITGRGTPYKTAYSVSSDEPVRLHSLERLINDTVDLITFSSQLRQVPILDELFIYDLARFKQFAEVFADGKMSKYIKFEIFARPHELTEEVCEILKHAFEIKILNIHFVSSSVKTLRELREPVLEEDEQLQVLERCYRHDFNVTANYLLGSPNETKEDLAKNYWFIERNYLNVYSKKTKINFPNSGVFGSIDVKTDFMTPVPGTELWQKAIMKRLITENPPNWSVLDNSQLKKETPVLNVLHAKGEFSKILEEYRALFQKKEIFSPEKTKQLTEFANNIKNIVSKFSSEVLDGLVKSNYFKENEQVLRETNTKMLDSAFNSEIKAYASIIYKLEEMIQTNDIKTILKVAEPINEIFEKYQALNKDFYYNPVLYNKELVNLSILDILEQIVKNNDINTVLQVTNPLIMDLKSIFRFDQYEFDTLNPKAFNFSRPKLPFDKKYDCIVLAFTLDTVLNPNRVIHFCHEILNDHGILIVSFFNCKSVFMINQILDNIDISKLFYTFSKINLFSFDSMRKLLIKHNFIPKSAKSTIFPNKDSMNIMQKNLINTFKDHYNVREEEFLSLSYTYSCRKYGR